jgi:hypothetical protein
VLFYAANFFFPIEGAGEYNEYDNWATFTPDEAGKLGIVPHADAEELADIRLGASGYRNRASKTQSEKELESGVQVIVGMPAEPENTKRWWVPRKN